MPCITRRTLIPFCAAFLAAGTLPALAEQPPGRGRGRGNAGGAHGGGGGGRGNTGGGSAGGGGASVSLSFSTTDQTRIRSYYAARPNLRPQPLPPGIQRRLARGKPLPPGIAKRFAPPELVAQIGVRPGFQLLVVGSSLVLLHASTGMVQDIMVNVFIGG